MESKHADNVVAEDALRQWRMKKLIQQLQAARGNGTSVITLLLPPGTSVPSAVKLLAEEAATADNIKSRVNRQSVQDAITWAMQRLKTYGAGNVPDTGLALFSGSVMLPHEEKPKRLVMDIVPPRPLATKLYKCDARFHVEALQDLLQDAAAYGFLIVDGSGALCARVAGTECNIVTRLRVDLPKKHKKGGQSAARFQRLRQEAYIHFMRRVAEDAAAAFIDAAASVPNVQGLILAGSAEFKDHLDKQGFLDPRLSAIVLTRMSLAYGGEVGLNEAIAKSQTLLADVALQSERKVIQGYFQEIAQDSNKYCFGVKDTLAALDMGAVETLLLQEDLEAAHPHKEPRVSLVEELVERHSEYGAAIRLVSGNTAEGTQFVKGFGGIGGILRWPVDFMALATEDEG